MNGTSAWLHKTHVPQVLSWSSSAEGFIQPSRWTGKTWANKTWNWTFLNSERSRWICQAQKTQIQSFVNFGSGDLVRTGPHGLVSSLIHREKKTLKTVKQFFFLCCMTAFLISGLQRWLKTWLLLTWPLPVEASSYLCGSLRGNYFLPGSEVCNFGASAFFQAPSTLSGTSTGKSKCYPKGVLRLLLQPDFTSVIHHSLIYLPFPSGICSSRWTSLLKPGFLSILLPSWQNFSDSILVKW